MKKRLLAFLLVLVMVAGFVPITARAEGEPGIIAQGTCGATDVDNVNWVLTDDGVLTISGTGAMVDYAKGSSAPWYSNRASITSIVVEAGVTAIGNNAFRAEANLTSVSLPSSVNSIGNYAFYQDKNLAGIELANIKSIGDSAFAQCTGITSADLSSAESIGAEAFRGAGLVSVTFGPVASMGMRAFAQCSSLSTIDTKAVKEVGEYGFYQSPVTNANLENAISIGAFAFSGNSKLTSVQLGENLISIGNSAFSATGIKELTIPGSVTTMGTSTFTTCKSLEVVTVMEGVTALPASTFENAVALERIALPASLAEVGDKAFNGCTGLKTLEYAGTPEQWSSIVIGADNDPLLALVNGEPRIESITATLEKTEYQIGEELDLSGLLVTAAMSDGTTMDVTAEAMVTGFDSSDAGEKTLTVTVGDFTTTITVIVHSGAGYDPATFVFTISKEGQETVVSSVYKESDQYWVSIPAWAIESENCAITITAPVELNEEFTGTYTAFTDNDGNNRVDNASFSSQNGEICLTDYYVVQGKHNYMQLVFSEEIKLQISDETYSIRLNPYCALTELRIWKSIDPRTKGDEIPVSKINDTTYLCYVPEGQRIELKVNGGTSAVNTYNSTFYVDNAENGRFNTQFFYTIGSLEEQTLTIRIVDEAYGKCEEREYTLLLRLMEEDPTPIITNYNIIDQPAVHCSVLQNEEFYIELETSNTDENTVYHWYSVIPDDAAPVEISGEPWKIVVDTTIPKHFQYQCEVTNYREDLPYTTRSSLIEVLIIPNGTLAQANISIAPTSAEYTAGQTAEPLSIEVERIDPFCYSYSYQWYRSLTSNIQDGEQIDPKEYYVEGSGLRTTFTPPTNDIGSMWYFCYVTATFSRNDGSGAIYRSDPLLIGPVEIRVIEPGLDFKGSGTSEDPFLIQTYDELKTLRDKVNEGSSFAGMVFKMTNNIALEADWIPIGLTVDGTNNVSVSGNLHAFSGVFDGGGNTLTVAYGGLPLFNYVHGATIKNLSIYGKQINGYGLVNQMHGYGMSGTAVTISGVNLLSGTNVLKSGLLGGEIDGDINGFAGVSAGYDTYISDCIIESGVTIGYDGSQVYIGSFAGRFQGTIQNCVSYATVNGSGYVGGIIGSRDNAMGTCKVIGCEFHGAVQASGNNAGGIVGGGYTNSTAPNGIRITVQNCSCSSTASVSGKKNVGGILGGDVYVAQCWSGYSFTGNQFMGTVSGQENVGGIIGFYDSLNNTDNIANNFFSAECGTTAGIGKVAYVDTSCTTHETVSGAVYFNTETSVSGCPDVTGCHWTTGCNRTDDPLGADANKLASCGIPTEPYVVELTVSGEYKTEYQLGDPKLITDGMVIVVKYNNGSTKEIRAEDEEFKDVEFSGFDTSSLGKKTIYAKFGGVSEKFTINVKAPEGKINVKLSILGDTLHEGEEVVHTLAAGNLTTWVAETIYTVDSNATVWNLLLQAFEANNITFEYRMERQTEYIWSVTYNGVTLKEFDNNHNSGWQYTINGKDSSNGVNQQPLVEGDVICFHWTDDYTQEDYGGQQDEDKQAAMAVEALIDALPAVDEITLADEEAIVAARAAYDALSDAAKGYVDPDCLAILVAAEARLAELKAEQAAADQAAADAVAAKIAAIGEVTLDSETAITEARAAYDALTDAQKDLVTNLDTLTAAEARLEELKAQQADQQAADAVTAKIAAIGEVTLDSETAITEARAAYEALTDAQKDLVTNLETLTAAETRLAELKAEQAAADQAAADAVIAQIAAIGEVTIEDEEAIAAARAAYEALTPEQKALVANLDTLTAAESELSRLKDQAAADAVIAQIAAIGEVTIEDEEAIAAARAAYDALTDAQKALVGNIDTLTAAETAIEALVEERDQQAADAVSAMIAALPAVDELTVSDEEAITAARAAYEALTDAQKAKVTNLDVLKAAEAKLAELKFGTLKTTVKAVNVKDGTIKLTWTTIPGAVKYKVLVSTSKTGTYKPVATVTGKTYSYKKGTVGKAAYFKVVGVNKEGTESAESAVATRFRLPGQVKGLKATSKEKKVTLKWTKVTGAKKYFVYVSKNGKTGWKKVGTVTTNKFVYEKGKAGKKLYFKVQAVTANGKKGEFSKVIGIKVKK